MIVVIAAALLGCLWLSGLAGARITRIGLRNQGLWAAGFLLLGTGLLTLAVANVSDAGWSGLVDRDVTNTDSPWVWAFAASLSVAGLIVLAVMLVADRRQDRQSG